MKECRDLYNSDMILPTTLKMFKDGTFETQASLMFEDYCEHGKGGGTETLPMISYLIWDQYDTKENFNIHTIGDAGVRNVLDVYKEIGNIKGTKTTTHNQVLVEGDEKGLPMRTYFIKSLQYG